MAKNNLKSIELYTDGACSGNPGIGGYGIVLMWKWHRKEIYGGEKMTTNNRMELSAVIKGLQATKEPLNITLYTDSKYVADGISKWLAGWIKKGWKKSDNSPVLNTDLWQEYLKESKRHNINVVWVKGHDGNIENERCDALARQAISEIRKNMWKDDDSKNKERYFEAMNKNTEMFLNKTREHIERRKFERDVYYDALGSCPTEFD